MENASDFASADAEKVIKECVFALSNVTGEMAHGVANRLTELKTLDLQLHTNYREIECLKNCFDASKNTVIQERRYDLIQKKISECEEVGFRRTVLAGKMSADIAKSIRTVEKMVADVEKQTTDNIETNGPLTLTNHSGFGSKVTTAVVFEGRHALEASMEKCQLRTRRRKRDGRSKRSSLSARGRKSKAKTNHDDVSMQFIDNDAEEKPYCLCQQGSYGEMILCENKDCPFLWFHFGCVNLANKPRGKWYCPNCRGVTSRVLKKELRRDK